MKLKKLLEINQMCEKRKAPWDIQESFEYESESLGTVDILDMDIAHFIRTFKLLDKKSKINKWASGQSGNSTISLTFISDQLTSLSKELKEYTHNGD
jgi:hypothetical protein